MTSLHQVLTDWTTASGSGKVSVMYFLGAGDIDDIRGKLDGFWQDMKGALNENVVYNIQTSGVDIEDSDGSLVGSWASATAHTDNGLQPTEPVADATQILLRWLTTVVADGHFVQGRTFIPGLHVGALEGGNLDAASRSAINGFMADFLATLPDLVVWHRPIKDPITHSVIRDGSFALVSSGVCDSELAVLRRRRN